MNYTLKNEGKFTTLSFTKEHTKAALEYWTQERMDAAIPVSVVLPDDAEGVRRADNLGAALEVKLADTDEAPFNAGGKLYFSRYDESTGDYGNYVGSAEFCADNRLILTAAHCFYKGGHYSFNIIFRRCYNNGDSAQETAVDSVAVPAEYIDTENYAYDYALGVTRVAAKGTVLNYEINSAGGTAIAYGYPANYENGKKMVYVEGEYTKYNSGVYEMLGNPMGGGCSGGAWVNKSKNAVVSVNSYSYTSHPDDQYGPILGTEFEELVSSAKEMIDHIRYFKLHNGAAVVVRMRIKWSLGSNSGTYEEDDYHDICAGADGTIDMLEVGIPHGATVRLYASVPMGDDDSADETFIYDRNSGSTASYKLSGTAFKTTLALVES